MLSPLLYFFDSRRKTWRIGNKLNHLSKSKGLKLTCSKIHVFLSWKSSRQFSDKFRKFVISRLYIFSLIVYDYRTNLSGEQLIQLNFFCIDFMTLQ